MVRQTFYDHCCECGAPDAGPSLICDKCKPLYPDLCDCAVCRSDMSGIVPCERESQDD